MILSAQIDFCNNMCRLKIEQWGFPGDLIALLEKGKLNSIAKKEDKFNNIAGKGQIE